VAQLFSLGCFTFMNDSDIKSQLRELTIKVDFIIETLLVFQAVWTQQALHPEEFQDFSQKEMRQVFQRLRRSAAIRNQILTALREVRKDRPPRNSHN